TGIVYVVYYDRRATADDDTEVYLARSYDGGQTFTSLPVSDSAFAPSADIFFGDYIGIAAWNRKVYPIWMRMDGGNLSVWSAGWSEAGSVVGAPPPIAAAGLTLRGPFPNPARAIAHLGYTLPAAAHVTVRIVDVLGREVARPVDGLEQPGDHRIAW